jgi:hypothetical protein
MGNRIGTPKMMKMDEHGSVVNMAKACRSLSLKFYLCTIDAC